MRSQPDQLFEVRSAVVMVVLATMVAYANSLSGAFVFDDQWSILENPTLRHLWPLSAALSPPAGGITVSGRPLLNLSLAVNYALGGTTVAGYHVLNLIIHVLASLTLYGIVRRTLLRSGMRERFGDPALPVAVALLWSVHPLQTEAVTYVVQRAESLMGLFYLLTLYCFIRGTEMRPALWHPLAVAACLCGMATKEVMASAPLMVLLYDRTFVAGSFRKALRQRWGVYLGMACSWVLLGWLVAAGGALGSDSAGFKSAIGWRSYAMTEFWVITHYLWLSVWPQPLVLDYGGVVLMEPALRILPYALVVILLLAGTVVSLRRWPAMGFAGCWFFGILALTSSVFPLGDTIFEHRMYLSLAAVVVLGVLGIHAWLGRWSRAVFLLLTIGFMILTWRRNEDYHSALALWTDTAAKRPGNPRAQNNLGSILLKTGRVEEAIPFFDKAIELNPIYAEAHNNLGAALAAQGRVDDAIVHYHKALEILPGYVEAHSNLGVALAHLGRFDEAVSQYRAALKIDPKNADALNSLGTLFAMQGKLDDAIDYFREALWIAPNDASTHNNLGGALEGKGLLDEAASHYQTSLRIKPDNAGAHVNLGRVLARLGRRDEAVAQFKEALRLKPDYGEAQRQLRDLEVPPE